MPQSPWLLEASWEVCNPVGGIYTVVTSKLPEVTKRFGDQYVAVGPATGSRTGFRADRSWLPQSLHTLDLEAGWWEPYGVRVLLLPGAPNLDQWRARLWETYQLDTLGASIEVVEPLAWSLQVGLVASALAADAPVVVHAHEWLAAGAVATYQGPTVFTTHATVVGRITSGAEGLTSERSTQIARDHLSIAKHQLEQLGLKHASVATAVSPLTAQECVRVHGVKPRVVANGIGPSSVKRRLAKHSAVLPFLQRGWLPNVSPRTKLVVSHGRPELHNKGFDLVLEALAAMRTLPLRDPVIAIFATPVPGVRSLADPGGLSPFREDDPIVTLARQHGFPDGERVRVFSIATDINHNPFPPFPVDTLLAAADVGVFPSRYEPFGYTPLEALRVGTPAVTSKAAGFAQLAGDLPGVTVLDELTGPSVARSLLQVLAHPTDPELCRETARHFSWNVLMEGYDRAYAEATHVSGR